MHTISVVVPAYMEELLISGTIRHIPSYIDLIYAIDDGSLDNTLKIIEEECNSDKRIIPIKHKSNRGVGAAIISGYKASKSAGIDIVVVMAGDDQMDPSYIPSLIDPIIYGIADYTKGNRLTSLKSMRGMSTFRKFGNYILTYMTRLSSGYWGISDPQNGYTAISNKALKLLNLDKVYPSYGYCNDLLVKMNVLGIRVLDVDIPARYGNEKSKINYSKYIIKLSWLLLKDYIWRIKKKSSKFKIITRQKKMPTHLMDDSDEINI